MGKSIIFAADKNHKIMDVRFDILNIMVLFLEFLCFMAKNIAVERNFPQNPRKLSKLQITYFFNN